MTTTTNPDIVLQIDLSQVTAYISQRIYIYEVFYEAVLEIVSGQSSTSLFYFDKPPAKPSGPSCQEIFKFSYC